MPLSIHMIIEQPFLVLRNPAIHPKTSEIQCGMNNYGQQPLQHHSHAKREMPPKSDLPKADEQDVKDGLSLVKRGKDLLYILDQLNIK
jgi:hypothetical protein